MTSSVFSRVKCYEYEYHSAGSQSAEDWRIATLSATLRRSAPDITGTRSQYRSVFSCLCGVAEPYPLWAAPGALILATSAPAYWDSGSIPVSSHSYYFLRILTQPIDANDPPIWFLLDRDLNLSTHCLGEPGQLV